MKFVASAWDETTIQDVSKKFLALAKTILKSRKFMEDTEGWCRDDLDEVGIDPNFLLKFLIETEIPFRDSYLGGQSVSF